MKRLAAATLAVALAGCANIHLARHVEPSPEPAPSGTRTIGPIIPGDGSSVAATPTIGPTPNALLEIAVFDRITGRPRSDIPVRIEPVRGGTVTAFTDTHGIARASVRSGRYTAAVVTGCSRDSIVTFGSSAHLGVSSTTHVRGSLLVEATRRYGAGPPVYYTQKPPWPRGRAVTFSFLLYDRCKTIEAPDRSVSYLRYEIAGSIELVDDGALRSDHLSFMTIVLRCTGPGDPMVYLIDPENPSDRNDVLSIRPTEPNQHRCG